jgi:peptide/nickel transport system substrate-binding protein
LHAPAVPPRLASGAVAAAGQEKCMTIPRFCRVAAYVALAALGAIAMSSFALAQTTLRVVKNTDLKILDPIWTTAYITRDHGYMIYDTLFATDANGQIKPQMVDHYELSADRLTYTITLRDGLLWHDGNVVTAGDCVASIRRWAARDAMGQKMMSFVSDMPIVDAKTFRIELNSPTGLVLMALGKPSSAVPFMMPKRVADTNPNEQITDYTGSGPFVFKKNEWKPGTKAVYIKFDKYKPRAEPPSGLAGGKVVKVDRVEWIVVADQQAAVKALAAGDIDFIEQPAYELLPALRADRDVKLIDWNPLGNQYAFRFNVTAKPFDDPRVRQALLYAFNQEDFLQAAIGDKQYYKTCKAMFVCATPLASDKGMDGLLEGNIAKAQALLKEAGYDGTPIVLLHSTDLQVLTNLAPIAKSVMEKAGFKVDMQDMDWQTLVARRAKKDPPAQGGWHAFLTSWASADILDPVSTAFLDASCDKALFGWPCDAEIEKLRDDFARETNPIKQKAIAEAVQVRWAQYPTHIHLGQWYQPGASRRNVEGYVVAPVAVFWNVFKTSK